MTKYANEIESKIETLKRRQSQLADLLTVDNDVIEEEMDLQHTVEELQSQICLYCSGDGEIIDRLKVHSNVIDIPYTNCPRCGGSGVIE